jgi:hypothetical protein
LRPTAENLNPPKFEILLMEASSSGIAPALLAGLRSLARRGAVLQRDANGWPLPAVG